MPCLDVEEVGRVGGVRNAGGHLSDVFPHQPQHKASVHHWEEVAQEERQAAVQVTGKLNKKNMHIHN